MSYVSKESTNDFLGTNVNDNFIRIRFKDIDSVQQNDNPTYLIVCLPLDRSESLIQPEKDRFIAWFNYERAKVTK
jgi:hypothetical protein